MPILEFYPNIIKPDINAVAHIKVPNSINADSLEFSVFAGGSADTWVDTTGRHTVSVVGSPQLVSGFVGFRGDKDNHLELDLKEEGLPTSDFTAICVGRFFQDASYSTCALMGASGGTSGSTDNALGFHGWNMGMQRTASLTRNAFSLSVLRSGTEYRQILYYNDTESQNDVERFRMQVMRVTASTKEFTSIIFSGYDGTSALVKESNTFSGSDTITGRLKGKTNIKLGTYNGYTGSDQCHFVYGGLFTEALSDAQVKDFANSFKAQFLNTDTVNGISANNGLTVATGYTPINLYAPAIV